MSEERKEVNKKREVAFNSDPQNAKVYINKQPILDEEGEFGRTPIVARSLVYGERNERRRRN